MSAVPLVRRVDSRFSKLAHCRCCRSKPGNLIIICIYASSAKEPTLKYLCNSDRVKEGKSVGFEVEGLALMAIRRAGQIYVYRNRCPHRGVALEWQPDRFLDSSASLIQCATHGALFLIESGECVAGPCEGQALGAIACAEDADGVWINLPEQARDD